MSRVWFVWVALAAGAHALLLFGIDPSTRAQPRSLGDLPPVVDLSLVESAPAAPATVEPPSPPSPPEPPVEPLETPPPSPELAPEPARQQTSEPLPTKANPPPRPPAKPSKPRTVSPSSAAEPLSTAPSRGSVPGAAPALSTGRGASTSARPRYRSNPKPAYPLASRRAGHRGVVMISVEVTAAGQVASARLARSSGYPLLDTAALEAVRRWTFDPARTAGLPMASRVEVPVRFELSR